MNNTVNKLEKIENKLKQYEDLIEDLIEFSDYCLKELESFGSGYLKENRQALTYMENKFKKIKL